MIWKHPLKLDELNKRGKNTLSEHLNIVFSEVTNTSLSAIMPITSQVSQPVGILHGGASCALAETVGSAAANYCVDPTFICVGLDININHLKSVSKGTLTATATPFHLGKSTQVWQIEIQDDQKRLIAISRLTMAVLKKNG